MTDITNFNFRGADVRTMTSREIAELTNKEHKNVLADIRTMLDDLGLASADFSADLPDAYGRPQPAFRLPKRECLILVSGYSIAMRARIIDRWEALETGRAQPLAAANGPSNLEQLQMAEVLASALRLDGSSRLKLMADATKLLAPALAPLLPVYAIDAPAGSATASSGPTESLTALMARFRVGVSTRAGNLILQERGLLEKRTRPSSGGATKSFWSVTEKGRAFGKNVSSPENPRETQPHWFSRKGEELLRVMGVQE